MSIDDYNSRLVNIRPEIGKVLVDKEGRYLLFIYNYHRRCFKMIGKTNYERAQEFLKKYPAQYTDIPTPS